jgi:hypothetical protein
LHGSAHKSNLEPLVSAITRVDGGYAPQAGLRRRAGRANLLRDRQQAAAQSDLGSPGPPRSLPYTNIAGNWFTEIQLPNGKFRGFTAGPRATSGTPTRVDEIGIRVVFARPVAGLGQRQRSAGESRWRYARTSLKRSPALVSSSFLVCRYRASQAPVTLPYINSIMRRRLI